MYIYKIHAGILYFALCKKMEHILHNIICLVKKKIII